MTIELITTPGSSVWVCPDNVFSVVAETWGASSGGGTGSGTGFAGGTGGGYGKKTFAVTPGLSYDYAIGAGSVPGAAGGDTYFVDQTCLGKGGTAASGRIPGVPSTDNAGDVTHKGGAGGAGTPGGSGRGGGGGGSAGPDSDGYAGANGITGTGGAAVTDGGKGGDGHSVNVNGDPGDEPGGGGGGGGTNATSASGRNGKIRLTYFESAGEDFPAGELE